MVYTILYYDIAWDVHAIDMIAKTIQAAIQALLDTCLCTRSDIITYYPTISES